MEAMVDNLTMDAKNWLFTMHETLSHEQFTRMMVTLWAIWRSRRKAIHGDIFESPFATHSFVNFFLRDLHIVERQALTQPQMPKARSTTWLAPPEGLAKVNVDAAVSVEGSFGAVAAVCQDQRGNFLGLQLSLLNI